MKKMIVIILVTILLVSLGLIAWVYTSANSIIAKYRPELEQLASNSLGAKVQLGEITVSMFPELALALKKIKVGSEANDLSLKEVLVKLKLMPLLSGVLDFSSITVDSPNIVVVKTAAGTTITGLPSRSNTATKVDVEAGQAQANAPKSGSSAASLKINLQNLAVKNGTVLFDDQTNAKKYALDNLTFQSSISNLEGRLILSGIKAQADAAGTPIDISVNQIVYTPANNLAEFEPVNIKLGQSLLVLDGRYQNSDGSGQFNTLQGTHVDLASLSSITRAYGINIPQISGEIFPLLEVKLHANTPALQGTIELKSVTSEFPSLKIGDLNGALNVSAHAEETSIASKQLKLNLNGAPVQAALDAGLALPTKTVSLRSLNASIFSGSVEVKGEFTATQANSTFDLRNIALAEAIAAFAPSSPKLQGTLTNLKGAMSIPLGQAKPLQAASGNVYIKAVNTSLPGLNLAGAVLASVKDLPFLQGALVNSVPPSLQDEITADSTVIKSITSNVSVSAGAMSTRDLYLTSNLFELDGQGQVDFDANLHMRSSIFFNKDFSQALANRTKELRTLFDESERLVIPLELKGHLPKVAVLPDTSKLVRLGAKNLVKEKAGKLLEKVLGGRGGGGKLFGF